MSTEYVIYTDESVSKGPYFSNFYGGVLVRSPDLEGAIETLEEAKRRQNLFNEIKWSKVTSQYLAKYEAVIGAFFDLVAADVLKVRVMFTQNANVPTNLTGYHRENQYHLLYYQFFKHAFGLPYSHDAPTRPIRVRLNLDQMPSTREAKARFRAYTVALSSSKAFRDAGVYFSGDQIAEVDSKHHVLLQCLDIVLGAVQFRLNDLHKQKVPGSRRRAKKTIAKEKLYKSILSRIREIYPGFNIGISTGHQGDPANRWLHPYRHWNFVPARSTYDAGKVKPKKR